MDDMNFVAVCVSLFALASWMLRVKLAAWFSSLQGPYALRCSTIFSNASYLAVFSGLDLFFFLNYAIIFFYHILILYCFYAIAKPLQNK